MCTGCYVWSGLFCLLLFHLVSRGLLVLVRKWFQFSIYVTFVFFPCRVQQTWRAAYGFFGRPSFSVRKSGVIWVCLPAGLGRCGMRCSCGL